MLKDSFDEPEMLQMTPAQPLHIQRLEASLNMDYFMSTTQNLLLQPLTDNEESSDAESGCDQAVRLDRHMDKSFMCNQRDSASSERDWLRDIVLDSDESDRSGSEISDEDEYVKQMLSEHVRERKYRSQYYQNKRNAQYAYYGTGLISLHDAHADHQRSVVGHKRPRKMPKKPVPLKQRKLTKQQQRQQLKQQRQEARLALAAQNRAATSLLAAATASGHPIAGSGSAAFAGSGGPDAAGFDAELLTDAELTAELAAGGGLGGMFGSWKRGGAGRKKSAMLKTPEAMAALRKRVWQLMAKKELGKVQRLKSNNHKEALINYKRMATVCLKIGRQRAMQSQKTMRETVWRAKRLTREMQGYWKKSDRVERDTRRRMEKEAEEQRKHDVELNEAKRQQRKLNFLITQTELYAHFMSRKLGTGSEAEQLKILSQLDEETAVAAATAAAAAVADDYDCDEVKQAALKNASDAFVAERNRTQQFLIPKPESAAPPNPTAPTAVKLEAATGTPKPEAADEDDGDLPQPRIFCGSLKGYQIKGMTWLAGLYDKGISGILADEMGLGKTVQSIAFLCHIAESSNVWGPFLVISPASTLHNWQQELQRFVPAFKVVPYWGAPQERKVLRQFWDTRNLHTREASFHVVVTSYQLIVSDYKYFNRIKWQCMILDEAQAIKSAASVRWKLLLAFNCRNRLLLSGTPIQNSMAELWALLHFIMPTLFDSHDEFNEWFSKDIESHAENKTGIDEQQISRLHMILKPFMLRRIKKDVENELSDKIEVMVYCPLTTRQRKLYASLKRQIRIEDLLQYAGGSGGSTGATSSAAADSTDGGLGDKSVTSNLMNLVMQFRKVCNHPELFERRDARSPFYMQPLEFEMPRLLADADRVWDAGRLKLLNNTFNVFRGEHIHRSIFPRDEHALPRSTFSFARFCQLETVDMERIVHAGLIYLMHSYLCAQIQHNANVSRMRHSSYKPARIHLLEPSYALDLQQRTSLPLRFTTTTRSSQSIYTFAPVEVHAMPETIEHRLIRSRNRLRHSANLAGALQRSEETPAKSGKTSPPTLDDMLAAGSLLDEHVHRAAEVRRMSCEPVSMPTFLFEVNGRISCSGRRLHVCSRRAQWRRIRHEQLESAEGRQLIERSLDECYPRMGWSNIIVPDKQTLVSDAGKLQVLDGLLTRLKAQKHRVLIYSQMTKVIDLLEEYMRHKKHIYMRLDGSSKISARRDMVADFQNRTDIFVFLLSTRAGGLGINLTAADTVIFYDSDWNPTVDQQAMDRAHRLGQTKQVTVYRLICKGTIEERILQRARKKSEIQRMVISGGNFKPDTLKPKEVVSLLLDDEEIDIKLCERTDEDELIEVDEKIEIDQPSASVEPTATTSPTTLPVDSDIERINTQS